jgi:N utilization substance protein B
MASRRAGREMALQVLCLLDRQPDLSVEQGITLYFQNLIGGELEEPAPPSRRATAKSLDDGENYTDQKQFAEDLVHGVRARLEAIDALLTRCSRNWRLERMSWVDRNLLRLACFELDERRDTPARVALNEAIEIARRYSTSESSGFVNGVLDRALHELGRQGGAEPAAKNGDKSATAATRTSPLYNKDHAADPR